MRRGLTHFWQMNLAVIAGVAVTTAVLTGALLVGDSLRGSLQHLTLDRLGTIEQALLNNRLFPADLAERLAAQAPARDQDLQVVPALLLQGSAVHPSSEQRASSVQVIGIDARFPGLYPDLARGNLDVARRDGQIFPSVVINEALQKELGAAPGDDLLLSFGRPTAIPSASLLGRREQQDLLTTLRVTVTRILAASGPGRFSLEASHNRPLNAFVDLQSLQRRLDRSGEVNLTLVGSSAPTRGHARVEAASLEAMLQEALRVGDLGLRVQTESHFVSVESRELVLRPDIAEIVLGIAQDPDIVAWPYLTYLANRMQVADRTLPYSTVSALQLPVPEAVGRFSILAGADIGQLADDQIALNSWAAEALAAKPGDTLSMTYYLVGDDDALTTESTRLTLATVVDMESLGADSTLTPDVPGISDAGDIAGWDPPFPVDLDLVGPADEAYWDDYRGAPKAFVRLEAGQDLWRSRYGDLTSIRLVPTTGDTTSLRQELETRLPGALSPEQAGFQWIPVLAQGLDSASGTTDFAQLFLGFSLFLIVSAALLVGLLFALLVEHRSREAGLLLATGYTIGSVRRRFLADGLLLASIGTVLGTGLAVLYTKLVLVGLTDWWAPILDSPILRVHLRWQSLFLGAIATLLLVTVVISWTIRRVSRVSIPQLLAGRVGAGFGPRRSSRAGLVAVLSTVAAGILLVISLVVGMESAPGLFFGVGSLLVLAGIATFAAWSQRPGRQTAVSPVLLIPRLAGRNCSRNLGRSLLSITLVASASFVLVSVSANRKTHTHQTHAVDSGTGGFTLMAETDTPLPAPLSTIESGDGVTGDLHSLRLLPGDDASCLSLYQPKQPRVLGVTDGFIERSGFEFRASLTPSDNPWTLLQQTFDDGAIPAIGDYNSVRWILHSGLGKDLLLNDDFGDPIRLRLVGLLDTSIFQSEVLISEAMFLRHFPDHPGYSYFLGEVPAEGLGETIQHLESAFSDSGLDARSTVDRLEQYQSVENMYLTTFEVLGGLGILLGTIGLGVVLLRNTLERRGELATLRAFGYRRSTLARLVVAENALLLVAGLAIGAVAGMIAVAPHLLSGGIEVPWISLGSVLVAIFLVGLVASVAAVVGSLRIPLLPALKAD